MGSTVNGSTVPQVRPLLAKPRDFFQQPANVCPSNSRDNPFEMSF
jgi:hypothetical protein